MKSARSHRIRRHSFKKSIKKFIATAAIGIVAIYFLSQLFPQAFSGILAAFDAWTYNSRSQNIPPSQIVEVTVMYTKNGSPPVKIHSITKKQGYAPKPSTDNGEYRLELIDEKGNRLASVPFTPREQIQPLPPEPGKPETKVIQKSMPSFFMTLTVTLPRAASGVRISDKHGAIIDSKLLNSAPFKSTKPNYHSIKGGDVKKKLSVNPFRIAKRIFEKLGVFAQGTPDTYFDVTFIGDDYTADEVEKFHTDVNRFISHMLTYEPYQRRAVQLAFHYVDNTQDLGCYYSGRLIYCDGSLAIQYVNDAQAPWDKIFVIYDNGTYGGAGGTLQSWDVATGYNGSWGPNVYVHELAHITRDIVDEYLASYAPARQDRNCYVGTPPNPAWEGIVGLSDYYVECNYPSWYRSSLNSIMRSIDAPYFNLATQKYLNDALDYYAGPFSVSPTPTPEPTPTTSPTPTPSLTPTLTPTPTPTPTNTPTPTPIPDTTPPTVVITSPTNGSTVKPRAKVQISATATDNILVPGVYFAINGQRVWYDSTAPYTYVWTVPTGKVKSYTIKAEAYDPSNNYGSNQITVNVK